MRGDGFETIERGLDDSRIGAVGDDSAECGRTVCWVENGSTLWTERKCRGHD